MKLAFFSLNKLGWMIKVQKDDIPTDYNKNVIYKLEYNVVYKLGCAQSEASYVGPTCRLLKTRIDEHQSHIRRNTNQNSVITEHRLKFSYDFVWNNVEILDEKIHFNKRIISEMVYIKKQSFGLNLQHDTDFLNSIYFDIIR